MRERSTFWSTLELAEKLHLGHVLAAFERTGIGDSLKDEYTPRRLADKHRVDPAMLEFMLEMLTSRAD